MIQKFNFKEKTVRTIVDESNTAWFSGIDVCSILDYSNPSDIIQKKLDEDERKLEYLQDSTGQKRRTWTINEFGLYTLILSSSKPEAKAFKRWITHEVLPAIRRAGLYTTDSAQNKELELQRLTSEVETIEKDISSYKSQIKIWNKDREKNIALLKKVIRMNPNQLMLEFNEEKGGDHE